MPHARSARLFAALSFVVLACSGAVSEDRIHQSFATSANPEVRLENVTGRIIVRPWDNNSVDITAVKSAADAEALANIDIEISKEGNPATWVRARAHYGHRNPIGSVEFTATVPRHAKLRISSVSGNIIADGFANDFTANTVTGSIETSMTRVNERRVSLHTVTGSIDLVIPRDSGAVVKVNSISGKVQSDFPLTDTAQIIGTNIRGRIGDGSGSIEMGSVAGSLTLKSQH